MGKREKVMNALRQCAIDKNCKGCAYYNQCWEGAEKASANIIYPVMLDALKILEEGETDAI